MSDRHFDNDKRFYLAQSDKFTQTELVFDDAGDLTPTDALLHAINFFKSDEHFQEVDVGDHIRISGPYPLGGPASTIHEVTAGHLAGAENL
jgi:hypothetical protein